MATEGGTITINNPLGLSISYTINGKGEISNNSETITIDNLVAGNEVQFFGENASYADISKYTNIQCSVASKVYGNIMSLIDKNNYSTLTAFEDGTSYNLANLFKDNTKLTDASGLILPATTLVEDCYFFMFTDCTSLNSVTCLATDISVAGCTKWLYKVADSGTFTKAANMKEGQSWKEGPDDIPSGWTVKNYGE